MSNISISEDRCKGCEMCISACHKHVIEMSTEINQQGYFYAHAAHPEKCTACKLCAVVCPEVGIEVEKKGEKK